MAYCAVNLAPKEIPDGFCCGETSILTAARSFTPRDSRPIHPRLSVKSVRKGTPYAYQVAAQFEGSRGSGRRLQLRACALTFVRQ